MAETMTGTQAINTQSLAELARTIDGLRDEMAAARERARVLRERLEGMIIEAEAGAGHAESAINLGWHNGYYEACRDIIGELAAPPTAAHTGEGGEHG